MLPYFQEDYEQLMQIPHAKTDFMKKINQVYVPNYKSFNLGTFPAFDELAMAVFLDSSIVTGSQQVYGTVCTDAGICKGQLVIDWKGKFNNPANIELIVHVDRKHYHKMIRDAVTN